MDKVSYIRLFQIYSDAITSDGSLGSELRQIINRDMIWNKLSDEERKEMKKSFAEIVNKISHEVLSKRNKSFNAFKRGMRKK